MFPDRVLVLAKALIEEARGKRVKLTTAESCTGGLIAGALTEIPGASEAVDRGFVVYSNNAKTKLLGVRAAVIMRHGAVSEEVARACVYLCSKDGDYITGTELSINGGLFM